MGPIHLYKPGNTARSISDNIVQWNIFLFLEDEAFVVACIHYAVLICAERLLFLNCSSILFVSLLSFVVVSSSTIHTA